MIAPVFFDMPFLPDLPDSFGGVGSASGSPTEFDDRQKSDLLWPVRAALTSDILSISVIERLFVQQLHRTSTYARSIW